MAGDDPENIPIKHEKYRHVYRTTLALLCQHECCGDIEVSELASQVSGLTLVLSSGRICPHQYGSWVDWVIIINTFSGHCLGRKAVREGNWSPHVIFLRLRTREGLTLHTPCHFVVI